MALISAPPLLGNKVTTQEKSRTRGWFHSKWCHSSIVQTLQQSSRYWKDSAEIIVLIEIREEAFRKGVSCAPANNNQFTRSPADLTNLLLMVRKIKMRRKVSVNYKEHTWGDLTDKRAGWRHVVPCTAPPAPLCTTLPHSTVQLHFALLYTTPYCSTPLYSALHHRGIIGGRSR